MKKVEVLGLKLVPYENMTACVSHANRSSGVFISIGAETLINGKQAFSELCDRDFVFPYADGIGAVWAARRFSGVKICKIPGCELWLNVVKNIGSAKIAIIGSQSSVIERVKDKLESEFGVVVAFCHDGYFEDEQKILECVVRSGAEYVFLGLGQPKQEFLAIKIYELVKSVAVFGIGGSFDLYCGQVSRAPYVMRALGLEWLYRLYCEPKRWRRQKAIPKLMLSLVLGRKIY